MAAVGVSAVGCGLVSGGVPGAAYGLVEGVGEVGLVLLFITVVAMESKFPDVSPGVVVEWLVDVVAVDPGDLGGVVVG
ncbi:hypothetical protein [Streptomyces sp. CA2R106]|uniref:hypothetical protein n=1 Tax=Streptomyces sp. CA2R106 TaxID=3120153 RepID=UPI00300B78E4